MVVEPREEEEEEKRQEDRPTLLRENIWKRKEWVSAAVHLCLEMFVRLKEEDKEKKFEPLLSIRMFMCA